MSIHEYGLLVLAALLVTARLSASYASYRQNKGLEDSWYQNQVNSDKSGHTE